MPGNSEKIKRAYGMMEQEKRECLARVQIYKSFSCPKKVLIIFLLPPDIMKFIQSHVEHLLADVAIYVTFHILLSIRHDVRTQDKQLWHVIVYSLPSGDEKSTIFMDVSV